MAWSMHGIGVGQGLALGHAWLLQPFRVDISPQTIQSDEVGREIHRLATAVEQIRSEIGDLKEGFGSIHDSDVQTFLSLQEILLDDPLLVPAAEARIESERCNADWALLQQFELIERRFDDIEDAYLRERKADVRQLVERILRAMHGDEGLADALATMPETEDGRPWILVAHDIAPADMLLLRRHHFAGLAIDWGSATAHTAILARSLGLPAVVGLGHLRETARAQELIALDSKAGVVMGSLDSSLVRQLDTRLRSQAESRAALEGIRNIPAVTRDGQVVELLANIELPDDMDAALAANCDGVGLFRTEFLFMNRNTPPGEEEQFQAYSRVVQALSGRPLTLRSLDAGADKSVPALQAGRPEPDNPALARRAIRLCLAEPELFLTQLRAVLRASALGPVQLLLPLISQASEVLQARALLRQAMESLDQTGMAYNRTIRVGAMIEVPSAAIAIDSLIPHIDFASIGTNDLIQYTLAVDRTDPSVGGLYDPLHPAVLRLIDQTVSSCLRANIPVSMCGEMAGEASMTPLLLGLGLRKLSMHAVELLGVKAEILRSSAGALAGQAQSALRLRSAEAIRAEMSGWGSGFS